jgi:copper chaperone CopZ
MTLLGVSVLRGVALIWVLLAVEPLQAEYLQIKLRVYGLDCQLCARGVSATIQRMPGVQSVEVSLKTGLLDIVLVRGNTFKMRDLRKRIRENGFRSMEATVTAVGQFNGPRFEVLGSGESYEVVRANSTSTTPVEVTFDIRSRD